MCYIASIHLSTLIERRYNNSCIYPAPAKMAVNAMVWNMDGMPGIFLTEYGKLAHASSSNISQLVCLFKFSFISLMMQRRLLSAESDHIG